jgi:acyl-homoserine lactone acylase PvdQ
MKKLFFVIVGIIVLVFGGLVLSSFWMGKTQGRDLSAITLEQGFSRFSAERNSSGFWQVKAKNKKDAIFAVGFLQIFDREFQLEMIRKMARGELASVFGEKLLAKDRLMRFSRDVSVDQWKRYEKSTDPQVQEFVELVREFVSGVNEFKKRAGANEIILGDLRKAIPIEYQVFQLARKDFPDWTPEDVFAIARAHTWDFSYHFKDEVLRKDLEQLFGKEGAFLLTPGEPRDTRALYEIPELSGFAKTFSRSKIKQDYKVFSGPFDGTLKSVKLEEIKNPHFQSEDMGISKNPYGVMGGSNIWVGIESHAEIKDGKFHQPAETRLNFCNDTHLGYNWPSPLFPMQVEISSLAQKEVGYMLPGSPWFVVGHNEIGKDYSRLQGIVLANFAVTQKILPLDKSEQSANVKNSSQQWIERIFMVRDMTSFELKPVTIVERWTSKGPVANEFLDFKVDGVNRDSMKNPWVLQALALTQSDDPSFFFFKRSFYPEIDVSRDLQKHFVFPSVHYNWVDVRHSTNAPIEVDWGHAVTGGIFNVLSSKPADIVPFSERPFFRRQLSFSKGQPSELSVLLAAANQKVYSDNLSTKLGIHWGESLRSDRIYALRDKIRKGQSLELQDDFYSQDLKSFFETLRRQVSADSLCGQTGTQLNLTCLELIAALDGWNGLVLMNRFEPTVIQMFYEELKWSALPISSKEFNVIPEDRWAVYAQWRRNIHSRRFMTALVGDVRIQKVFEKFRGLEFEELAKQAFRKTLNNLSQGLGPDTSLWPWGRVHTVEFLHPFARLPGFLGQAFPVALLGSGVAESGNQDSLKVSFFNWDPRKPLEFKANHGQTIRFCAEIDFLKSLESESIVSQILRWDNLTGSSGNPLSKWSKNLK